MPQLRTEEVKYNIDGVGGNSASGGEADTGSAPGRVPAEVRQLSRQNAFKVRGDEALVEKAMEAYDATGGGVAGMQVREPSWRKVRGADYDDGSIASGLRRGIR